MKIKRALRWFTRFYFRVEFRGLENISSDSCIFIGNHNCGAGFNPESLVAYSHIEPVTVLAHDLLFRSQRTARFFESFHLIPAKYEKAKDALNDGKRVLLYPGGGWESCRPSRDRDRIDFKGRNGFARLAIETSKPIIPIVAAGAHDGWYVLFRGDKIARFLRIKKFLRVDVFPIGLGFPYGVVIGAFLPVLPLPRKIILQVLPPISPPADDTATTDYAQRIIEEMQVCLDELVHDLPRTKVRKKLRDLFRSSQTERV